MLGPWAEAVTAASDGTLQVQTFYGGTLGNFGNTYDRVVDQVVDVGFILFAFASGKFKQQDVAALPFEAETAILSSIALWNIYEQGLTAKEFDAVKSWLRYRSLDQVERWMELLRDLIPLMLERAAVVVDPDSIDQESIDLSRFMADSTN